jgi:hypothetical protein
VLVEPPARVDLLPAVREVRVLAVGLRATAGEVLRGARDAVRPQLRPLHAPQPGGDERRRGGGVLPERLRLAGPARFGREVDLRVQGGAQAQGQVLLPGDVGEPLHQLGVTDRGQAERLRPLRQGARGQRHADVLGEPVPRVAGEGDRDAVRGLLRQFLHRVLPADRLAHRGQLAHVEVAEVEPGHQVPRRLRAERPRHVVGAGLAHPGDHVEQQTGLLRNRQPGEEVRDALGGGQAWVLVGVQHAVAVEVPVPDPVG